MSEFPIHPITGLTAIGFTKRGPVWPVMGGSEDAGAEAAADESGADATSSDVTPPESNGWWSFSSKDDAAEWANGIVEKRLARERKKLESIVTEHGTLKAEVEELRPLKVAKQTDTERWESEKTVLAKELEELRGFKSQSERNDLVRRLAEEKGLPTRFVSRIQGDDEDSITSDIEDLLNVLSEDGKSAKKPASQKPKATDEQPGIKGHSGGGSDTDDDSTVGTRILKKYRESRNSFSL